MKKIAIFLLFAGFIPSAKSQVTTYLIDYTNENLAHPCNVFNSNLRARS
ncbi:hypothetical protein LL912_18115 [Niabella sp. CC-SYL272]|nr:hypothetical protein [Niabella agricola]MCF3110704.1 hypothetical protein [Niabella agricola]